MGDRFCGILITQVSLSWSFRGKWGGFESGVNTSKRSFSHMVSSSPEISSVTLMDLHSFSDKKIYKPWFVEHMFGLLFAPGNELH